MAIHETRIDEPTGCWVVTGEGYVHESRKNCLGCQFHNDLVPTQPYANPHMATHSRNVGLGFRIWNIDGKTF